MHRRGQRGAPEPGGDEHNPYYETITFEATGSVTNAESQQLAILRYHQLVTRKSNDEVFHDQVGFWLWDAAGGTVTETFTIPRGVAVVATGSAAPVAQGEEVVLSVAADADAGIAQSPFMQEQARTTGFTHTLTVRGDKLTYQQTTLLDIYGRRGYAHSDENALSRVE